MAVDNVLAGFLMMKLIGQVAEIGLDCGRTLLAMGWVSPSVCTCLRFASATPGAQSCTLVVGRPYPRTGQRPSSREPSAA
jgi:hypothetical protein